MTQDELNNQPYDGVQTLPAVAFARELLALAERGQIASVGAVIVLTDGNVGVRLVGDPRGSVDGAKIVLGTEQMKRLLLEQLFPLQGQPSRILRPIMGGAI